MKAPQKNLNPLLNLEKIKLTIYGTPSVVSTHKTVKSNTPNKNQTMLKKCYLDS